MTSVATVLAWRPEELGAVAGRWRAVGRRLDSLADGLESDFDAIPRGEFEGDNRHAAQVAVRDRAGALRRDARSMDLVAEVVDEAGRELGDAVTRLRGAVAAAEARGYRVDRDTGLVHGSVSEPVFGQPGERGRMQRDVRNALDRAIVVDNRYEEALGHQHPEGAHFRTAAPLGVDEAAAGIAGAQAAELERIGADDSVTVLHTRPGTTAVAVGDVGAARTIITVVPGTKSSADDLEEQLERARHLRGNDEDVAVVVWTYDAPNGVTDAASAAYHREAAPELRAFQHSLAERGPAHLHVVGYSYGATVAAQATRGGGLRADSLSLAGSPGVGPGLGHVRDMRLLRSDGRVHDPEGNTRRVSAATSPTDAIGLPARMGVHGKNPAHWRFGASGPAVGARVFPGGGGFIPPLPLSIGSHTGHYFGNDDWARHEHGRIRAARSPAPGGR